MKKLTPETELLITAPMTGSLTVHVRGLTPFICNAPSEKAKHELLLPKRKSSAERNASLKHNPLEEYRNSAYKFRGNDSPTRIFFPSGAFKKASMSAALEIGGASKASIARLVWVVGMDTPLYGIPRMLMSVTRSADINHTPDIRTRAILPNWVAKLEIRFMQPKLNHQAIVNLLHGAGLMIGCGDWRQEKGSGSYGQFEIVNEEQFNEVAAIGGREAQDAALENPGFYDVETEQLYEWYTEEVGRRRQAGDAAAHNQRAKELSANGDNR